MRLSVMSLVAAIAAAGTSACDVTDEMDTDSMTARSALVLGHSGQEGPKDPRTATWAQLSAHNSRTAGRIRLKFRNRLDRLPCHFGTMASK